MSNLKSLSRVCLAALLLSCGAAADEVLPTRAYIHGVPFVAYHEMRDAEFPGGDVYNPSATATAKMMYAYWGADFLEFARSKAKPEAWETLAAKQASLDDLKALVARGLPVELLPATTPEVHRLYPVPKVCAVIGEVDYVRPHLASGALGEMVVLEAIDQLRSGGCEAGLNDSVYLAARLLVGYDDERGVVIVHDPSFGPNLEIGYADFERMWRATEANYWVMHPADQAAVPAGRVGVVRARTPDDEAGWRLFRAYGQSVKGDYEAAERLLREALAIDGIGPGRQHLLRLELAVALNETGRCQEAIEELRRANAAFDGYWLSHKILSDLLGTSCGGKALRKESKRELSEAKSLCSPAAQRRVADVLGHDFHVMGCGGELLGWYRP